MKSKRYSIEQTPEGYVVAVVKEGGTGKRARFRVSNLIQDRLDFLSGVGSVLDLGGTSLGEISLGSTFTDRKTLEQDFSAIGRDFKDLLGDQLSYLEG